MAIARTSDLAEPGVRGTPDAPGALLLRWTRFWVVVVMIGLVVSGITAFPLLEELTLASSVLHGSPLVDLLPGFIAWVDRVRDGLDDTYTAYPFIAYGTDWLAFAHLLIAVAFIGPLRDPVRNIWVLQWGMIACAGIVPLALIAGWVRGLPLGWQLIDISFAFGAIIPLAIAHALTRRLERIRGTPALSSFTAAD